jgi:hypothetical protein
MATIESAARGAGSRTAGLWLGNILVKLALIGLLLLAVVFPDWPQFTGKGIGTRLATYPLSALVVPAVWLMAGRARRARWRERWGYPYLTDLLVTAPFMLDTLGNALNLFDTVEWWDDMMHFANWALLCGGLGTVLLRCALPRYAVAGLIVGLGSVLAVLWEVGEYFVFIRTSPELQTAYTDTLGDLALGTAGGVGAALVAVLRARAVPAGRDHAPPPRDTR